MRITLDTKSYMHQNLLKMLKKVLIKLAIGLVLDVLISVATKKFEEAETDHSRMKWLNILEFLSETKTIGLP